LGCHPLKKYLGADDDLGKKKKGVDDASFALVAKIRKPWRELGLLGA
jgi:hypothetical protein